MVQLEGNRLKMMEERTEIVAKLIDEFLTQMSCFDEFEVAIEPFLLFFITDVGHLIDLLSQGLDAVLLACCLPVSRGLTSLNLFVKDAVDFADGGG